MKKFLTILSCAAIICLMTCEAKAEGTKAKRGVTLYDTGTPMQLADVAASLGEDSWKVLGKDAAGKALQGDAVLINKKIAAIIRKDGSGVELYAKGEKGWNRRGRIAPVVGGILKKLTGLKVSVIEGVGLGIDADLEGVAGTGLIFTIDQPGFPAVKVTPRGKVEALRFLVPCRLGILPDFWTDDLMIDARTIPMKRMEIPAGNIFLHPVAGGDSLVAAVWEKSEKDIEVALSGDGEKRTIDATDIFIGSGGSVWAAILEQKSIWHGTAFTEAEQKPGRKGKKLDWAVPFIAKWKGNITLKDGTVLSRQFKYNSKWHDGSVDSLFVDKKTKALTALLKKGLAGMLKAGSIDVGTGKDSAVGEHGVLAVYPISRDQNTPLNQYCIDDLLRLLGTEVCSYVLDLDARHGESKAGSEKGIFTCAESVIMKNIMPYTFPRNERALAQFIKDERAYRRHIDAEVLLFITLVQNRINSYVAFRKSLLVYLDEQEKKHPKLVDFIGRLRKQITKPTPIYGKGTDSMKLANGAEQAQPLLARRAAARQVDTPENATASLGHFRGIGDPQDGRVQGERLKVARIRVMVTMEMAVNPEAAELGKEIRARIQKILRNPTTWEKPKKW